MKFTEKNNFIVRHTSGDYFAKDLELFKLHCPDSKLHSQLKRVNSFTRQKLDGQMLHELLDKISPAEILKNREATPETGDLKELSGQIVELQENIEIKEGEILEIQSELKDKDVILKELTDRINALQDDVDINESDISDLRLELEDKDASIEELEKKIAELETRASVKKKANLMNSPD